MQDCGSCQHFVKVKNDPLSGGICQLLDQRTDTDRGLGCEFHKRIPYKRKEK